MVWVLFGVLLTHAVTLTNVLQTLLVSPPVLNAINLHVLTKHPSYPSAPYEE